MSINLAFHARLRFGLIFPYLSLSFSRTALYGQEAGSGEEEKETNDGLQSYIGETKYSSFHADFSWASFAPRPISFVPSVGKQTRE